MIFCQFFLTIASVTVGGSLVVQLSDSDFESSIFNAQVRMEVHFESNIREWYTNHLAGLHPAISFSVGFEEVAHTSWTALKIESDECNFQFSDTL